MGTVCVISQCPANINVGGMSGIQWAHIELCCDTGNDKDLTQDSPLQVPPSFGNLALQRTITHLQIAFL